MKKIKITFLLIVLTLAFASAYADTVKEKSTVDYQEIDKYIIQKATEYGESQVLVVMDIDNTILTSHTDLGGDIWYQWQRGELDIKPTEDQKITECFYQDVIGLLYELNTMDLTDTLLPNYITNWQNSGITVFALTSRSPKYRTPTERELKKKNIDLSKSALKTVDGYNPIYNYSLSRELSYMNGIMMTTGMDKGEMLDHIIGRSGSSFKAIIFIDDTKKNIDNVKRKYNTKKDIDVTTFYYQKIAEDRIERNGGVILTQDQANKMAQQWAELDNLLKSIFPGRNIKGECVSLN